MRRQLEQTANRLKRQEIHNLEHRDFPQDGQRDHPEHQMVFRVETNRSAEFAFQRPEVLHNFSEILPEV